MLSNKLCPICNTAHHEDKAHNIFNRLYRENFFERNGRAVTWADSYEHCSLVSQISFEELLSILEVDPHSANILGPFLTREELEYCARLATTNQDYKEVIRPLLPRYYAVLSVLKKTKAVLDYDVYGTIEILSSKELSEYSLDDRLDLRFACILSAKEYLVYDLSSPKINEKIEIVALDGIHEFHYNDGFMTNLVDKNWADLTDALIDLNMSSLHNRNPFGFRILIKGSQLYSDDGYDTELVEDGPRLLRFLKSLSVPKDRNDQIATANSIRQFLNPD